VWEAGSVKLTVLNYDWRRVGVLCLGMRNTTGGGKAKKKTLLVCGRVLLKRERLIRGAMWGGKYP